MLYFGMPGYPPAGKLTPIYGAKRRTDGVFEMPGRGLNAALGQLANQFLPILIKKTIISAFFR
jgi:hypothetical protein